MKSDIEAAKSSVSEAKEAIDAHRADLATLCKSLDAAKVDCRVDIEALLISIRLNMRKHLPNSKLS